MRPSAAQLGDYLAPEESLVAVSTGTLYERSSWNPMAIGITDRRLVCVADNGWYVTVGYDAISTIRSHPRTTRTYRGPDSRLLMGGGALLALLGGIGVVVLATSGLVPVLALVTVGGVVAAEYLRRNTAEFEWEVVTGITKRIPFDIDGTAAREWYDRSLSGAADTNQLLSLGSGGVAVLGFIGLLLLVSSGFVVLGMLAVVGGIGLVDYARRHKADLEGFKIVRHRMSDVNISIQQNQPIRIRCDPSREFVQELSRAAFMIEVESRQRVLPPSPPDTPDGSEI